ncbi:MAG: YidC/Oxa1 family membrane protein insertase [Candidatus Levybacteria bacterium]|nr:YidC/Oxa1 family membrane protein insertase [Candidatus Levybacteria bacterium]
MFDTLFIHPIINLLVVILHVFLFLHIPYALGFSIIALTILIRVLLYPLMTSQMKMTKKMQDVNPHLSRLKEQYKNDSKRLQQETMALYKNHGINPAAGCLPVLIQLPLFFSLYTVIQKIVSAKAMEIINSIVYFDALKITNIGSMAFFGLPLGDRPSQLTGSLVVIAFLIPIITGVLQFVQSKMITPVQPKDNKPSGSAGGGGDFAKALQMQTTYILPVMIGFFSYSFPIGLSLYWNTFTKNSKQFLNI